MAKFYVHTPTDPWPILTAHDPYGIRVCSRVQLDDGSWICTVRVDEPHLYHLIKADPLVTVLPPLHSPNPVPPEHLQLLSSVLPAAAQTSGAKTTYAVAQALFAKHGLPDFDPDFV